MKASATKPEQLAKKAAAAVASLPVLVASSPAFALVRRLPLPRTHAANLLCLSPTCSYTSTAPMPHCRTRSTYHATHAAFFPTQVDDRLNGDGVGHPLGVNEPILGWVIGGVASLIWVLYFIAQRDFGDFGGWQPAAIALHCACLSCLLPTLLSPPNPV